MSRATSVPSHRASRRVLTCAVLALAIVVSACGSDVPSKADFESQIGKVTGGRVTSELASCVYDKLEKDQPELLRRAITTPDLSDADDKKMQTLLAQCVLIQNDTSLRTTTTRGK
jgi:hypothetical protein